MTRSVYDVIINYFPAEVGTVSGSSMLRRSINIPRIVYDIFIMLYNNCKHKAGGSVLMKACAPMNYSVTSESDS
jgi:hypothetical protein